MPSEETTYWCQVHRLPEEFRKKRHLVRYEPIIKKGKQVENFLENGLSLEYFPSGNEGLVHHMELFHCEVGADLQVSLIC